MRCSYFEAGVCRSCTLIETPYARQLEEKQAASEQTLRDFPELTWLEPVPSREAGFRNKAKMVIGGSVDAPTIGILDRAGIGVDLRECGITAPGIRAIFPALSAFISEARLEPYDVSARRGELKHVLVTEAPDGELMLRFVVRSEHLIGQIRKRLPALLAAIPRLRVVSVNLLPEHKAVLEGERETVLTEAETLPMAVNGIDLHLGTRSFFQTNTEVAAALYRQGRDWANAAEPASLWDLYCGVGGFALHSQAPGRTVTGIEFSPEAIVSAERSRDDLLREHPGAGFDGVRFAAGDATAFALGEGNDPDLVIVNPPRRGIGPELSARLESSSVTRVIYSSCNPTSLATDLAAMPSLRPVAGRLFDMFPHTTHAEVMVLLERQPA